MLLKITNTAINLKMYIQCIIKNTYTADLSSNIIMLVTSTNILHLVHFIIFLTFVRLLIPLRA